MVDQPFSPKTDQRVPNEPIVQSPPHSATLQENPLVDEAQVDD